MNRTLSLLLHRLNIKKTMSTIILGIESSVMIRHACYQGWRFAVECIQPGCS